MRSRTGIVPPGRPARPVHVPAPPTSGPGGTTGADLLLGDLRLASLLADEVRVRAMARAFSLSRKQANLATLAATLTLAQAAREALARLWHLPPMPTLTDCLISGGGARRLLTGIAGAPCAEIPAAGDLLVFAVITGLVLPQTIRNWRALQRGVRQLGHALNTDFHHRYGYLVDPGHWRERRATVRGALTPTG